MVGMVTKSAIAVGAGLIVVESGLYGFTYAVPDVYSNFTPTACGSVSDKNTSALQRAFMGHKDERVVVTAVAPSQKKPGEELDERTFIVEKADVAKAGMRCPLSVDWQKSALPRQQYTFGVARGQYIGGVFSPLIDKDTVSAVPNATDVAYDQANTLFRANKLNPGFTFGSYNPGAYMP